MRITSVIAVLLAAVSFTAAQAETLIPLGSDWKYLDDGSDQGTNWVNVDFDDSAWTNGPAELGYGDNDENTVISYGGVASTRHITYYFRHTFLVTNASDFTYLAINLIRDDGAVVYVNGAEVLRDNMPTGAVSYLTLASTAMGNAVEAVPVNGIVEGRHITNGWNTIAVEIHQSSRTSSDVSFDLELTTLPPELLILLGSEWSYLDDGSDQGTAWQGPDYDDRLWPRGFAQLGYGDGDERTVIGFGGVETNKYITYYFRKTFLLSEPMNYPVLFLQLVRDDGAIVYINSNEVWRSNMPEGPVNYLTVTPASVPNADEDKVFELIILSADLLVSGSNVVAVEVHQRSVGSTDLGFDFGLTGLPELPAPSLVRKPYLQSGTPTSIVVRWRTDFVSDSVVGFSQVDGSATAEVASLVLTTEHEVVLSGLLPETDYAYTVGYGTNILAGGDAYHTFKTAVPAGVRRPVRVWALGDSGTADGNARSVRDAYHAWTTNRVPDVWLMLGDNAYNDGYDDEYQAAVFDMYTNTLGRAVLWPTLGNHDGHSASSALQNGPYYDIFTLPKSGEAGGLPSLTEAYYSFDYANVHFVCLESYQTDRTTNGAMYIWAKNDIAATTQDWVIAFWHHPPYSRGSHDSDTDGRMKEMREKFLPMLEDAGVDLILGGHSHSYERTFLINGHYGLSASFNPGMQANSGSGREGDLKGVYDKTMTNGAVYAVAGSSGKISGGPLNHAAMVININQLGSMVLDIDGDELDAYFINSAAVVQDWFTLRKNTAVFNLQTVASGQGTVVPVTSDYLSNTIVHVTATPGAYHLFNNWAGDLNGSNNPAFIVMDNNKSVTGVFDVISAISSVPQWWLNLHGLTTNLVDVTGDQDGDLMLTFEEYIADTIPTSSSSHFRVTSIVATGAPVYRPGIQFQTSTSRMYSVEKADVVTDGSIWSEITTNVTGDGSVMTFEDDNGDTSSVYRIKVRMP